MSSLGEKYQQPSGSVQCGSGWQAVTSSIEKNRTATKKIDLKIPDKAGLRLTSGGI
jgi:hypothetical protein